MRLMHDKVYLIFFVVLITVTLVLLSTCSLGEKNNINVSGKIINSKYDTYLTERYLTKHDYNLYIPQYYKPHSVNPDDGEGYFDKHTYEYLTSHTEDYVCYLIEVSISNDGVFDIFGYKFQLSKDYSTSVILWDVFQIESFETWKPGECMSVYVPVFIDTTKYTSNDDIEDLINDLSLLFTYETVNYPTELIDNLFGWIPDSRCIGENTITIR